MVHVYLDPRKANAPDFWRSQAKLVLSVGCLGGTCSHPVRCCELVSNDAEALVVSTTVGRAEYVCIIPWASVFALSGADHLGHVWNEDIPEEVRHECRR
jgi:hypothetical protein